MLGVCLRLALLLPLACCVPSSSKPPPRMCRRCCDHLEPPAASTQYQMPEVRTVINMTILKGKRRITSGQRFMSTE
uniref:Secreted protein n=1 Tax=Myripristis murdjan TaxID=586833 RepID=A0A667WQ69_9TELE